MCIFTWDYSFEFMTRFIVLSLGETSHPVILDGLGLQGNCQNCFVISVLCFEISEVFALSVKTYFLLNIKYVIIIFTAISGVECLRSRRGEGYIGTKDTVDGRPCEAAGISSVGIPVCRPSPGHLPSCWVDQQLLPCDLPYCGTYTHFSNQHSF